MPDRRGSSISAPAALLFQGGIGVVGLLAIWLLDIPVLSGGLGLVLGAVYQLSGSLELVMVWHAVYDMLALYCLLTYPHWFGVNR